MMNILLFFFYFANDNHACFMLELVFNKHMHALGSHLGKNTTDEHEFNEKLSKTTRENATIACVCVCVFVCFEEK